MRITLSYNHYLYWSR